MQWYYERDGQQVGPVSQAELIRLVIHRDITPQTLVWHPAFGNEWRPASKAGLAFPSGDVKIFSLTLGQPKPTPNVAGGAEKKVGKVPSLWAWILLLPALLSVAVLFVGQAPHSAVNSESVVTGLCISAILFLALMQDRKALTLAGVTPPSFWWWLFVPVYFWWWLFVPVYFWCRWRIVGRGFVLFILSILFMIGTFITFAMNPPPGFPHIALQTQVQTQKDSASSSTHAGPAQASPQEEDVQL